MVIRTIAMTKDAFWKHNELLRRNVNLLVKMILHCYVFSSTEVLMRKLDNE